MNCKTSSSSEFYRPLNFDTNHIHECYSSKIRGSKAFSFAVVTLSLCDLCQLHYIKFWIPSWQFGSWKATDEFLRKKTFQKGRIRSRQRQIPVVSDYTGSKLNELFLMVCFHNFSLEEISFPTLAIFHLWVIPCLFLWKCKFDAFWKGAGTQQG